MHAFLIIGKTQQARLKYAEKFLSLRGAKDIIRLEPLNRTHTIGNVRELIHSLSLRAPETRGIVIDSADKLNPESANAFLKTLEEPPQNTIITLTAPSKDSVIDTIISRCVVENLGPLELELSENEKSQALKTFEELSKAGIGVRFKFIEGVGDREEAIKFILGQIYAARERMLEEVKGHNLAVYAQLLELLVKAKKDLESNVNVKLALTELMLHLPPQV
ncbi:MAG: hypothetical protein HYW33_01950 [Candidatus Blackburnbacteria bacterium]|nr:hypothetical protein [Candidatus Blackburnbacteria bacterium]